MDNLTHSLTGLALARAGLNRYSPYAGALLILSANAPDIDIVALSFGSFRYFEEHRGYTHSVLLLPVLALVCVLAVAAFGKRRLPWRAAWLICAAGVASHLLLDWTNSYGVRLLLPFSSRWFHLDLNSLYDVPIWIVLAFAALWPMFSRLVSGEIGGHSGNGRGLAIVALAFLLLFDGARALLHGRVLEQLSARLYDGAAPIAVAALPNPWNPLRWTGIVETVSAYQRAPMDALDSALEGNAEFFYKPAVSEAYRDAKATAPFRFFSYFARFPVWSEEPATVGATTGTKLVLADLRFGTPQSSSHRCVALEDDRGRVLRAEFMFGK